MSDARVMRERQLDASDYRDRTFGNPQYGNASVVCQTTVVAAYPVVAVAYYAANPCLLSGAETEGTAPVFTVDTDTIIYVANVGSAIPPLGTFVVAHLGSNRYAFRFDG